MLCYFCLFTFFSFLSSSEEKDAKTETKDEKGEGFFLSLSVIQVFSVCKLTCLLSVVAASGSRNLWVSGLSSTSRATDLKALFSKHGKVSVAMQRHAKLFWGQKSGILLIKSKSKG